MRADYASLMARYQAGDAHAFETLYDHLALELPHIVRSLAPGVPPDEALITEIFVDIHNARRSYHPRHPFERWVTAIVQHAISRHTGLRRRLLFDFRARFLSGRPRHARPAA